MRRLLDRWKGIALAAIGIVATLWLGVTGQLGLYIHPRYFVFTLIMAVIAIAFVVLAFVVLPGSGAGDEDHDHDHERDHEHDGPADAAARRSRAGGRVAASARGRIATAVSATIVVAAGIALLALPPATLTTATASNRELNAAGAVGDVAPDLVGGDTSSFTVKDWALLLSQNPDPATFAEPVEVTGFVLPSPDRPDDAFYVARFTVTCCAVDAQPVGVPVHLPGWQERFAADEWVTATGRIVVDPAGGAALVLQPESVEPTEQPEQPYVF